MSGNKRVNDKKYWKERHEAVDDLKASGLQSVGLSANTYIYKILEDQYGKLLTRLNIDKVKTILDAGYGDGYFLRFFTDKFSDKTTEGIDISPAARKKIDFIPRGRLHVGDLSKFNLKKKFDIVHCFDVLYHILDEKDYNASLANLALHSKRYIILHERFLEKSALISSPHVRMRRREVTNQTLNSQGFFLHTEMPTHFLAMRTFTFTLNKLIPRSLYKIDNHIANNFSERTQERLGTHFIRVYKKAGT